MTAKQQDITRYAALMAWTILQRHSEAYDAISQALADGTLASREELFLTTKLWNNFHRPELVREGAQDSMTKLGVDYIDLYLIHFPVSFTPGTVVSRMGDADRKLYLIASGSAIWTPPQFDRFGKVSFYTDTNASHARPDGGWFERYMIGTRGLCSVYDPPVSYWCSEHPSGGGAFAFRTPSGVTPKPGVLPNGPYADASDALLFVWRPARWANWMFEIKGYDAKANNFTFGKGGNQGARGENSGGGTLAPAWIRARAQSCASCRQQRRSLCGPSHRLTSPSPSCWA